MILPYLGEVHVGTAPFGQENPSTTDIQTDTNTPDPNSDAGPDTSTDANTSTDVPPNNPSSNPALNNDSTPSPDTNPDPNQEKPPTLPYYDYSTSDYDLWLSRDADVAVDAARSGNEARFVNDYRGVPLPGKSPREKRKRPNAEFKVVWDPRLGDGKGEVCMAVYVLPAGKKAVGRARTVGVGRGEEVLVSYGRGFWEGRRGEGEGEWW